MSPTTIETFQKANGKFKNLTASVDIVTYETALRVAELNGHLSVSSFVKDCILEKIKNTANAMALIADERKTVK